MDTEKTKICPDLKNIALARLYFSENKIIFHRGEFYEYKHTHYEQIADINILIRKYLDTLLEKYNNHGILNIRENLKALASVEPHEMPFNISGGIDLDSIPVINGLLEPNSLQLEAHTPNYVNTLCLPFNYNPTAASCKKFIAFLNEIYADDRDKIPLVQEIFGYSLVKHNLLRKLFIFTGRRTAGKGVLTSILKELAGAGNYWGGSLNQFTSEHGLYPLYRKNIGIVGEVEMPMNGSTRNIINDTLKRITGGDPLEMNQKYKDQFTVPNLPIKLFFCCNDMPTFLDHSGALAGRCIILKHNISFYGREKPELLKTLLTELEGIFNWALEGLQRLNTNKKFSIPLTVAEEQADMRRDCSEAQQFLEECCLVHSSFELDGILCERTEDWHDISGEQLYECYCGWSRSYKKASLRQFVKNIKSILPIKCCRRVRAKRFIEGTGDIISFVSMYGGVSLFTSRTEEVKLKTLIDL